MKKHLVHSFEGVDSVHVRGKVWYWGQVGCNISVWRAQGPRRCNLRGPQKVRLDLQELVRKVPWRTCKSTTRAIVRCLPRHDLPVMACHWSKYVRDAALARLAGRRG